MPGLRVASQSTSPATSRTSGGGDTSSIPVPTLARSQAK